MDIKALADSIMSIFQNGNTLLVGSLLLLGLLVTWSGLGQRIARGIEDVFIHNWQLALLGSTGIVLSLASGYTTWDGMSNFTCSRDVALTTGCTGAHILSAMVTFGIQGVMLIVAWLIGESFATGMSHTPNKTLATGNMVMAGTAAALLCLALGIYATGGLAPAVSAGIGGPGAGCYYA
jgi:hypothetical protein